MILCWDCKNWADLRPISKEEQSLLKALWSSSHLIPVLTSFRGSPKARLCLSCDKYKHYTHYVVFSSRLLCIWCLCTVRGLVHVKYNFNITLLQGSVTNVRYSGLYCQSWLTHMVLCAQYWEFKEEQILIIMMLPVKWMKWLLVQHFFQSAFE